MPFSDDVKNADQPVIAHTTADYLLLVDWSGRAILHGKKGVIPGDLPPFLQRLQMHPEQYLVFVGRRQRAFANVLGAVDKIRQCAAHFEKAFLKGQTAAAALFSPGN